jgi:hypothetical protein
LLDRSDRQVARIRQEGPLYWVSYPWCLPEPPLEGADEARHRAVSLALTLDEQTAARLKRAHTAYREARRQAEERAIIKRHHPPANIVGGYRFPAAPKIEWREIVATEVFGGREWRPVVTSDGAICQVSRLKLRPSVNPVEPPIGRCENLSQCKPCATPSSDWPELPEFLDRTRSSPAASTEDVRRQITGPTIAAKPVDRAVKRAA